MAGKRRQTRDALAQLRGTVGQEARFRRMRDHDVRAARNAGATWTDIAKILGVTPQAVQQRYGKPLPGMAPLDSLRLNR